MSCRKEFYGVDDGCGGEDGMYIARRCSVTYGFTGGRGRKKSQFGHYGLEVYRYHGISCLYFPSLLNFSTGCGRSAFLVLVLEKKLLSNVEGRLWTHGDEAMIIRIPAYSSDAWALKQP